MSDKNIILLTENNLSTGTGVKWYNMVNDYYKNILLKSGYTVLTRSLYDNSLLNVDLNKAKLDKQNLIHLIKSKKNNDIFIFNPIHFAMFMVNIYHYKNKEFFYYFLGSIRYIILWQEILNEDLSITGYLKSILDTDFILFFFKNSLLNLINNRESINTLEKNGIFNNKYFTISGYSKINNIIPLPNDSDRSIDVLIYGTISKDNDYRNKLIKNLLEIGNKFNIKIIDDIYGKELDDYLMRTKIVVHTPSHENLNHIPWAKITYLQSKKIFFIIEYVKELEESYLHNLIVFYEKNNVNSLYKKIDYFLSNSDHRNSVIENNYKYITTNADLDISLPKIIDSFYINFATQKSIMPNFVNKNNNIYAFYDIEYDTKWSSIKFYFDMINKIKKILNDNNISFITVKEIDECITNVILIIDISLIINMLFNKPEELEKLLKIKYILIVGENIDETNNTFMGWNQYPLNKLNFSSGNILYNIINKAHKITYQNIKFFNLVRKIRQDNIIFFPIDGFLDSYVIDNINTVEKNIDVLYYGAICYPRRMEVIQNFEPIGPFNYVICNNVFDLDNLIARSKIILHVNSLDNCYHIPFAKLMKLLSNNKIVLVEETEELANSELLPYVKTFKFDNLYQYNNNDFNTPEYLNKIHDIIKNYDKIQEELNKMNPQKLIKEKYNFTDNVMKLLEF